MSELRRKCRTLNAEPRVFQAKMETYPVASDDFSQLHKQTERKLVAELPLLSIWQLVDPLLFLFFFCFHKSQKSTGIPSRAACGTSIILCLRHIALAARGLINSECPSRLTSEGSSRWLRTGDGAVCPVFR